MRWDPLTGFKKAQSFTQRRDLAWLYLAAS